LSAQSSQINPHPGLWRIPTRPGSGFDIELTSNNDLFMIWYTYTEQGDSRWYLASGDFNDATWTEDVREFNWDGSQTTSTQVGNVTINFQDNNHATISWSLNGNQGTEPIEFFQFENSAQQQAGTWYQPTLSGYGLTHVQQGSIQVNVLYFYDSTGNPVWTVGSSGVFATTVAMDIFSGACPACPFRPSQAFPAGNVSTVFQNELNGILSTNINLPAPYNGQWLIDNAVINNLSE